MIKCARSLAVIKALPKAGADVIEIGMPFTDPMADGPAIQAAGLRALKSGQTLNKTLQLVRDFRKSDNETPIVLMGYYNPIYVHGVEAFLAEAKTSGVDGLIVVDLPPEEDEELCLPALKAGLNFIRFGVRDAASAAGIAAKADGVVVGSALVEAVRKALPDGDPAEAVASLVRELAEGVRSATG